MAYAVNAFLPLLRQGQEKKVVYITSAAGDIEFTRHTEMPTMLGYCISKAAGNLLMAKYAAELKADGIVTLSLSPGWVATDAGMPTTDPPFGNTCNADYIRSEGNYVHTGGV